jgi:hypothetical protein
VKKAKAEVTQVNQLLLNYPMVKMPTEFTREGISKVVARHIACDDQVCLGV